MTPLSWTWPSSREKSAAPCALPWAPTATSAWSFVVPGANVGSGSSMSTQVTR